MRGIHGRNGGRNLWLGRLPRAGWWGPFVAGAAAGLAAGVVLGVRRQGVSEDVPPVDEEPGARTEAVEAPWERAWAGAVRGLDQARELLVSPVAVDLVSLNRRLSALPGGDRVRVRELGEGIVEVVGAASDETTARVLRDAVSGEPGVDVVVNRIWTPSSAVHNLPGL